jgi:hypothetical protein
MSEETRRVLDLLAQGKVTVDEADRLLRAIQNAEADQGPKAGEAERPAPRYLRINVHKTATDRRPDQDVNIRVPIAIVKGGMRLGALIAPLAGEHVASRMREHGLDLDLTKLDAASIESILKEMGEVNIDVDSGKQQVRITCE